jgi:hypothetical protein
VGDVSHLLEAARRTSARAVNAGMITTYCELGRRIVEFEQGGEKQTGYGEELILVPESTFISANQRQVLPRILGSTALERLDADHKFVELPKSKCCAAVISNTMSRTLKAGSARAFDCSRCRLPPCSQRIEL